MKKFKMITLCGSTKFKDVFHKVANILTLEGYIVLMPHCYTHADNIELDDNAKAMLVNMHYQMIDMSDAVFIIDVGGYIGDSTKSEMEYAIKNNKTIIKYSESNVTKKVN